MVFHEVKDQEATILEMVQEEQKKEAAFQKATGEKNPLRRIWKKNFDIFDELLKL